MEPGHQLGDETFQLRAIVIGDTRSHAARAVVERVPLRVRGQERGAGSIVSDALVGHVDVAGALFDRLLLSASLPVTFIERGTAEVLSQAAPLQTIGIGDPRVGLMFRVAGQAERDAVSLCLRFVTE